MLKNSLTDIAAIILLRNDKILHRLIFENSEFEKDNVRNFVDEFYPNSFRKPAIDYAIEYTLNIEPENIDLDYEFDFLEDLFQKFFEIDGSFIVVKDNILEEYSAFINKVHPYNIVGYYLAKKLNESYISEYTILEFAKNITPLCFKKPRDFKEYVDNHIHAGGSVNDFASLMLLFNRKNLKKLNLPRLNEFSLINSKGLEFDGLLRVLQLALKNMLYKMFNLEEEENNYEYVYMSEFYNKGFSFDEFINLYEMSGRLNNVFLKEMINYYKKGKYYKFGFLFNVLMFKSLEENDIYFDKAIKIFLHTTNIFRSYIIMSQNIGLTSFSEFNRSSFKKNRDNLADIADTIISSGTTKFEIKFSPSDSIRNLKKRIISTKKIFDKEIIRNSTELIQTFYETKYLNSNDAKIKYHFCIHFIREKENKKTDQVKYYKLRKKLEKQAIVIDKLLKNQRIVTKKEFYKNILNKYEKALKNQYMDLSKLITTIDIAGDENRTPPEVFAPVIKFLRRDLKIIDGFKFSIVNELKGNRFLENHRLKLSIHAGEDFNHIVTGMRRIDEYIEFYKMKEYDRIAHALAIGIDPKLWAYRNKDIVLTKQEDLDNLVWMYFKAVELSDKVAVANRLKDEFLGKIIRLSEEIYGEKYEIYDLYEAWKLREYCPIYFDEENSANEFIRAVKFKGNKNKLKKAIDIFRKYSEDYEVYKRGSKIVKLNDRLSEKDFEFYEALQDYMIEKIAQKRIYIETNPTSNIYIGFFENFKEHPIFRWFPLNSEDLQNKGKYNKFGIRNTRVNVCINTDDPMIMPTTLFNEYNALKNAVRYHTNNEDKIRKWLENIRKQGLEIFDNTHKHYEYIKVDNGLD